MSLWQQVNDAQRKILIAHVIEALHRSRVPLHLHDGLTLYFSDGILPGSFLQAVLCNDLKSAVMQADPIAAADLRAVVEFLLWECPHQAWGSREAVLNWTTTPQRLEV
jgi:hypothetical protein